MIDFVDSIEWRLVIDAPCVFVTSSWIMYKKTKIASIDFPLVMITEIVLEWPGIGNN